MENNHIESYGYRLMFPEYKLAANALLKTQDMGDTKLQLRYMDDLKERTENHVGVQFMVGSFFERVYKEVGLLGVWFEKVGIYCKPITLEKEEKVVRTQTLIFEDNSWYYYSHEGFFFNVKNGGGYGFHEGDWYLGEFRGYGSTNVKKLSFSDITQINKLGLTFEFYAMNVLKYKVGNYIIDIEGNNVKVNRIFDFRTTIEGYIIGDSVGDTLNYLYKNGRWAKPTAFKDGQWYTLKFDNTALLYHTSDGEYFGIDSDGKWFDVVNDPKQNLLTKSVANYIPANDELVCERLTKYATNELKIGKPKSTIYTYGQLFFNYTTNQGEEVRVFYIDDNNAWVSPEPPLIEGLEGYLDEGDYVHPMLGRVNLSWLKPNSRGEYVQKLTLLNGRIFGGAQLNELRFHLYLTGKI